MKLFTKKLSFPVFHLHLFQSLMFDSVLNMALKLLALFAKSCCTPCTNIKINKVVLSFRRNNEYV